MRLSDSFEQGRKAHIEIHGVNGHPTKRAPLFAPFIPLQASCPQERIWNDGWRED